MKRMSSFIITILALIVGISNVKALTIGNCDVLLSYKPNSSLDETNYICKNQVFGDSTANLYYDGTNNKIVLNNFSAYYLAIYDNVSFVVNGTNNISLLHTGEHLIDVSGEGNVKFKEDSYVKKVNNGELVYNYLYQGKTIVKSEKLIYEGTKKEFLNDYNELAEVNNLPKEFDENNFEMVQAIDFVNMSSGSITDEWMQKHITTNLESSVVDGYGFIRYVKVEEPVKQDENKTLVSENVILVSDEKINSKYELSVSDLSSEKEKVSEQIEDYNVLSLYDVSVYNGKKQVKMKNGKYTIKIKLSEEDAKYQNHRIIYVDDDGKVAEYFDGVVEDGYVVFETTHLSQYGVIAMEVQPEEVVIPKVSKRTIVVNLFKISVLAGFSLVFLVVLIILILKSGLIKKRKRRRA